jgi:hypothetical protein
MTWQFGANGGNLLLGRGALMLDRLTSAGVKTGLRFVGNVQSLALTTTDETIEKFSSVERGAPLLKRVTNKRTIEIVAGLDEFDVDNLALGMMGSVPSSAAQSALTAQTTTLVDVQLGRWYSIASKYNLSNVVVKVAAATKALGTDYKLDVENGLIYVVPTGTIVALDDLAITYDQAAKTIKQISGGSEAAINAYLMFQSDNASGPNYRLEAWSVSITPDGDLGFISDDFGTFNLRMAVQNDAANNPNFANYKLETVT